MKLSATPSSQLRDHLEHAREHVEAETARTLSPLSSVLKAATMRLVGQGTFF